jgi:3,4-dihydroxy 2-butanone 4-phosphate synthase/GTP cyclohydrolase II
MQSYIKRVEQALQDIKQGKIVIVTDHPDREDEGDFIMAAEKITDETMNFIIRHSSGIVCLTLQEKQLKQLNLPFMVAPHENTSLRGTPFTVSIDAREGITTGVSAADRARTILAAIDENAKPDDLDKPGHIFPLWAKAGGVLERPGHTEGSIDLAVMAGLKPAAVICEVMNPDGTMTRGKQLEDFAKAHGLLIISIDDIIDYRRYQENLIEESASAELPLESYGQFKVTVVKEKITGQEHAVIESHKYSNKPIVRIHSSCFTGDIFGSLRCDCHQQLHFALQRISEEGGILIYLNQEGRGIGLLNKIKAYALQESGFDTIEANQKLGLPADSRKYYLVANILKNRDIKHIRLLTNNPNKVADLQKYGITKVEVENIPAHFNQYNQKYLMTKKAKLNHDILSAIKVD